MVFYYYGLHCCVKQRTIFFAYFHFAIANFLHCHCPGTDDCWHISNYSLKVIERTQSWLLFCSGRKEIYKDFVTLNAIAQLSFCLVTFPLPLLVS